LADKFDSCLKTARSEAQVHEFLERYPHILPGVYTYHNGPICGVIITKLPLGNDFVTDFAFVSNNSQQMQITFVEIESPTKRIFRKDGSFTREYIDAKQQLIDWNKWGQENLRSVMPLLGPMGKWVNGSLWFSDLTMHCVLVMGRRSELSTRKRKERWAAEGALRPASVSIMTYDRLLEKIRMGLTWPLEKRLLVCSYSDRDLHVKRIAI
jgi:antiviral defense system Shedu protein SduA